MPKVNATTLTIRITDDIKAMLQAAADAEHRSKANMIEFLVIDYCKRNGIVPEKPASARGKTSGRKGS